MSSWTDPDLASRLGLGKPWDCPQGAGKPYRACSHSDLTLDQWKSVDGCLVWILAYGKLTNYSVFLWRGKKYSQFWMLLFTQNFCCLFSFKRVNNFNLKWSYINCDLHKYFSFAVYLILKRDNIITISIVYGNMLIYDQFQVIYILIKTWMPEYWH